MEERVKSVAVSYLAVFALLIGAAPLLRDFAGAQPASLVKIDGSSTVFPITEAVSEEFQKQNRGSVRVTVGISGTGGGFKKFCRGETDIQDASRPIAAAEMEVCKQQGIQYYELPVAFDAMALVVSRQNAWADSLSVAELKTMWEPQAQGKITRWNQIRTTWPDAPLKLFGAGSDSGTFDYFTEAIVGKAKASRGDYTASEDDNTLVQGIANDKHALGYIPFAYYEPNSQRLKAVAVDAGRGGVLPSRQTVESGTYRPLARPIFIYVSKQAAERPEVRRLVDFYLTHAAELVAQVKYVPLPKEAYRIALEHFHHGKLGTSFQGASAVGLTIGELLARSKAE
ncbi:MAG: PstS family phosphate ABC transporter substrate-binding protein [Nitrospirae bacterium]|nr:MAG: PstS family phosphate ABC transporter substrate-binding protein [Nitrospirota bacterium]